MAALIQLFNGVPNFTPSKVGIEVLDVNTKLYYKSMGTSSPADWVLVNGSGGGGGFGISSGLIEQIDSNSPSTIINFDCDSGGTLLVKADDVSSIDINLNLVNFPDELTGETVNTKMLVMIGETAGAGAIATNINASSSLLGNDYRFNYIDSFIPENQNGFGFSKSYQNKLLTYDINIVSIPADSQSVDAGLVTVTKTGETNITVQTTGGGGG